MTEGRKGRAIRRALTIIVCAALPSICTAFERTTFTLEERATAVQRVERVLYAHRTGTNKSFETAYSADVFRRRAEEALRKAIVLARDFHTEVTPEELALELRRIVRDSQDTTVLHEMFSALGDDTVLIQEVIVRPIVVDRLLSNAFAADRSIHSLTRQEAESYYRLFAAGDTAGIPAEFLSVVTYSSAPSNADGSDVRHVTADELREVERGVRANLAEDRDSFAAAHIVARSASTLSLDVFRVPKISLAHWLSGRPVDISTESPRYVRLALPLRPEELVVDHRAAFNGAASTAQHGAWTYPKGLFNDPDPIGLAETYPAVWTGSEMLVWHGTGARYRPATDTWTPMSSGPNCPGLRESFVAVWTGREMIVWGGIATKIVNGTVVATFFNDGGRYDPTTDSWTTVSSINAPSPRCNASAIWTGSEMILWGGAVSGGGHGGASLGVNTGGRYDPIADTWRTTSTMNGTLQPRHRHSAIWTGNRMIVWGGETGFDPSLYPIHLNSTVSYDPATDTWQSLAPSFYSRTATTVVWTGTQMIVWGGITWFHYTDGYDYTLADTYGWVYTPQTDRWDLLPTAGQPSWRHAHCAVWTGSEMLVWGGTGGTGSTSGVTSVNTGGRFNPSTRVWAAMPTDASTPTARSWPSAVWTGSEMLVWGGAEDTNMGQGYVIGGARFDPASNSWRTLSEVPNRPRRRGGQASVWTGSELIEWGGFRLAGSNAEMQDGGIYTPATDSWRATAVTAATPPPSWASVAPIWTGKLMIVYGYKYDDNVRAYVVAGGRYDPVADTWQTISDPPSGPIRYSEIAAQALWTSAGMLLVPFDGSGRTLLYDPAADSWSVRASGPATGTSTACAVWTGTTAIIWSSSGVGGRYDLAADTWAPISTVNAPAVNTAPVIGGSRCVWTGSEMLLWGGSFGNATVTSAGARYSPTTDSWSAMSSQGAPSPRTSALTLWDGQDLIVWGGAGQNSDGDATDYDSDGALYSPGNDSWQPMPTCGLSGRLVRGASQFAVWTGTKMIIWGGSGGGSGSSGRLTGAIYDPFVSEPAPTFTSVSPAKGVVAGGTKITITGMNFVTGAAVMVGGTAATQVAVVSSTSMTAVTPAHAAGAADIVITNTDAQIVTASGAFTYVTQVPGDVNGDGQVAVSDVFYLVNYLFASGAAPVGSGDVNGDGATNAADVFYLTRYLFAGGPAPR